MELKEKSDLVFKLENEIKDISHKVSQKDQIISKMNKKTKCFERKKYIIV